MIVFKLALKNTFSRKSSLAIIAFISLSIGALFFTNSIFDSTDQGIQKNFIGSLTGNIVIRPVHHLLLSLFGDETPVTGEISSIPLLENFPAVKEIVAADTRISSSTVQLTGKAIAEYGGIRLPVTLFGVENPEYFEFMSSVTPCDGVLFSDSDHDIFLNRNFAEKLGVAAGDTVQFIVADGLSSRIRKGTVACVYEYPSESSLWESLVICSSEMVRDLMKYDSVPEEQCMLNSQQEEFLEDFDMDSLFDDAEDFFASENDVSSIYNENISSEKEPVLTSEAGWNFLLCRVKNQNRSSSVIRGLNRRFRQKGLMVQAVDWRNGAGSSAMYVNILRMILNGGIFVILFVGFIIVNNTLVISVMDRLKEIGTLRAIGAKRSFVCLEFMLETLVLSSVSCAAGIFLGCLLSAVTSAQHIALDNAFLVQLFGKTLGTTFCVSNFVYCAAVSFFIGMVSWIYPVLTALKISPVEAMSE